MLENIIKKEYILNGKLYLLIVNENLKVKELISIYQCIIEGKSRSFIQG